MRQRACSIDARGAQNNSVRSAPTESFGVAGSSRFGLVVGRRSSSGAGAEGGGAVVAVGELTAVEREAAAADAFGEAVLEALEFGDALVDS